MGVQLGSFCQTPALPSVCDTQKTMANLVWKELKAAEIPTERSSHGISVVGDSLYLFGGEHTARTPVSSTLHVLDMNSSPLKWRTEEVSGSPPSQRFGHAQATIDDCIYVFGGRAGTQIDELLMNDLHKFDTQTRTWTAIDTKGDLPSPRSFHKMVALNNKLYVFGGCPAKGRLADLHMFDPHPYQWTKLPESPMEGRGGAAFAAVGVFPRWGEGKLMVLGGFAGREVGDMWEFDVAAETWSCLSETLKPPRSVACCEGVGTRVLLFGGELQPSDRCHEGAGAFSSDTQIFDASTSMKVAADGKGKLGPPPRGWSASTCWGSGKVVVAGGLAGDDENPVRMMDVWVAELN